MLAAFIIGVAAIGTIIIILCVVIYSLRKGISIKHPKLSRYTIKGLLEELELKNTIKK